MTVIFIEYIMQDMLDKVNTKLLLELYRDGKASNTELARKLGMSVMTVAKRVKKMLEEGVITVKAIPNPEKMGYQASAFIGLKVGLKYLDDICNRLKDNIHINLLVTSFGRFDILLIVYFREWASLNLFIKEELSAIKGVNYIETYIVSEPIRRYQGIFQNNSTAIQPGDLDEIDYELIKELIRNGRPSYSELSKKLGVSISTVSRRISALIEGDVIEIVAIPNPSRIGYFANAFVVLKVENSKTEDICKQLSLFPEVHLILKLLNHYDILFGVNLIDIETLYDFFKKKIAEIDGILSTETFICGDFLYFSSDAVFTPFNT